MTTKVKIISGFVLMVLLLGVIAFIGYRTAQNAAEGFTTYRRLARFNTTASDLETEAYRSAWAVDEFVLFRREASRAEAGQAIKAALEFAQTAKEFTKLPETQKMVADLEAELKELERLQEAGMKGLLEAYRFYIEVVQQDAAKLTAALSDVTKTSARVGNSPVMLAATDVWSNLSSTRYSVSSYAESRNVEQVERTRNYFSVMDKSLAEMNDTVRSPEGTRQMQVVNAAFAKFRQSFEDLVAKNTVALDNLDTMDKHLASSLAVTAKLNDTCNQMMNEAGQRTASEVSAAQTQMLGVSAGGLVAGVLIALFIVLGLVRVLNRLSVFATEVSRGNFKHEIIVREGGEIGAMVRAMRAIPEVISKVINDAHSLTGRIVTGHFRDRLETTEYTGGFADLGNTFNAVSEAYTTVLDNVPVPVMACDKERNVTFFNKVAQGAVGGNITGQSCSSLLKAEACADNCLGLACMNQDSNIAGETVINPQCGRMEVAVTAVPLHSMDGEIAGFIEVINDLTEIKDKQNTIITVANEASEIADRVAAASEQIAAQVEQISRGAELQRDRVETTASAMTEMNSTVLEVARNAGQASEQSDVTRQRAEGGADLVNRVVSAIHTVNTVSQAMQKNMEELGQRAESIGSVMGVISDIADQTNLLALNAAIEAARAGEAGRGFAVVADSVRQLAEKTMAATQEVGSNISAIQDSARKNMQEMENAAKGVSEATELANESGDALNEIVELAAANSSVVASIATAAEEQSATSEEINRAIEEINKVVGETTEGMVQSSAAVQDLSRMAQELRRTMDGLR